MSAGAGVRARADRDGAATLLDLRVQAGARRPGVAGTWQDRLKLRVRAPADAGRANAELRELVAELFELPRSAVELVSGHAARSKTVRLDAPPDRIAARLQELLGP